MRRIAFLLVALIAWPVPAEDNADSLKTELKRFSGTWKVEKGFADHQPLPPEALLASRIIFENDTFMFKGGPIEQRTTFKVDAAKHSIEIAPPKGERKPLRGLYQFNGIKLTLCVTDGDQIPDKLESGANRLYLELIRDK